MQLYPLKILTLLFFIGIKPAFAQSFSIYSVYKYGDQLTDEQYKKIHTAEWHKQEAKIIMEKVNSIDKQIKIYDRDIKNGDTKAEKKKTKAIDKRNNLSLDAFEHKKESDLLFYQVYNEKINVLWEKYESGDKAIVILKAMEDKGHRLFTDAKNLRVEIQKNDNLQVKYDKTEKSCKMEERGLDMISSALEGYYNYELELKKRKEQGPDAGPGDTYYNENKNPADTSATVLMNGDVNVEIINTDFSLNNQAENVDDILHNEDNIDTDSSDEIIISPDALLIYHDNEEITDLILNNYNVDELGDEVIVTSVKELREKSEATGIKKDTTQLSSTLSSGDQSNNKTENEVAENNLLKSNSLVNTSTFDNSLLPFSDGSGNLSEVPISGTGFSENSGPTPPGKKTENNEISDISLNKGPSNDLPYPPSNADINKSFPSIKPGKEIVFKIQIAASKYPLPDEIIRKKYNGPLPVVRHFENGWYKYTIGSFVTVEEAKQVQKDLKRHETFISAYQNNKKIDVNRGILLSAQQNGSLEYRVQVAASRAPLSDTELKQRYSGNKPVKMTFEENWYKYTIEGGNSYNAAYKSIIETGVIDAFVAIYLNNARVSLQSPLYRMLCSK